MEIKEIKLKPASKQHPDKKWQIVINKKHKVHFGAKGYTDFLLSKDAEKRL
jgi:hypothetical protein